MTTSNKNVIEHPHSLQCDSCENLKSVVEEIQSCVKNESQSISFYAKNIKNIIYDFLQAKKHIFDCKAHILHCETQDLAKQDVLRPLFFFYSNKTLFQYYKTDTAHYTLYPILITIVLRPLDATSALITMERAMKFQCQTFGEKQSEWFGKRGLSWQVSSVVLKQAEEPMVITYTHMFDTCTQECFTVASILENLLLTLKMENPSLSKAFIRSDEAGCYHNSLLRASIHGISQRTGVVIERYEFSEPRHLNDICDRIICPMKQAVRYCDEGHDIQSAADMRDSLLETTVQGVTASVCEVSGKQKSIDVTKIPNFSAYHNFKFEPRGIRVRRAYSVGLCKTLNYTDIVRKPQGPASKVVRNKQNIFDISVKKHLNNKQSVTVSEASKLSPCSQEVCSSSF